MSKSTIVLGSLRALDDAARVKELFGDLNDADVVVVPTAAAFTGLEVSALECARPFEAAGARVEGLMVSDRTAAGEIYFAQRVARADLVVVGDGAALHARTVLRATAFGEAIVACARLVLIGSVASIFGETMIDPRGGAPTTGLGRFDDLVVTVEPEGEQRDRTRELLAPAHLLCALGPNGVVVRTDRWRASGEVVCSRGPDVVDVDEAFGA